MARPIDLDQLMKYPLRHGSEHCDEKNADPRFLNGVESILEWAQTLPTLTPPNEWISVEERLPPNMDDVLVVVRDNGECWPATGYYSRTSNVWYAVLNGQDTQMEVLWWMPFPASPNDRPPEGEEGDANRG